MDADNDWNALVFYKSKYAKGRYIAAFCIRMLLINRQSNFLVINKKFTL